MLKDYQLNLAREFMIHSKEDVTLDYHASLALNYDDDENYDALRIENSSAPRKPRRATAARRGTQRDSLGRPHSQAAAGQVAGNSNLTGKLGDRLLVCFGLYPKPPRRQGARDCRRDCGARAAAGPPARRQRRGAPCPPARSRESQRPTGL